MTANFEMSTPPNCVPIADCRSGLSLTVRNHGTSMSSLNSALAAARGV